MKAAIYTLGCKVNQYESRFLAELLEKNGYRIVDIKEDADVYIVNSCSVTAAADQKTRQRIHKLRREHPESVIVLTGCMPQAFPKETAARTGADIILGNKNNAKLIDLLNSFFETGRQTVAVEAHAAADRFAPCEIRRFEERTRAIVKIQDGCNRFCSYCIIPYSRGRVRSKPLQDLKSEIETLAANGYREIVLVGINLSSYGQDLGCSFPDAVSCACAVNGIERVRLGSLEPDHLTEAVLNALSKAPKLCPQFHISLQSGCDRTLRAMNRHYTAAEFRQLCQELRTRFPGCTLTTDVMVGFCGETEADFEESLQFVQEIGFEKLHVFPYSVRPGTKAASMPGHLTKKEKEARAAKMIALGDRMRQTFFESCIGKEERVLIESTRPDGDSFGYTANYTPVLVKTDAPCGSLIAVRITGTKNDAVTADPIE